MPARHGGPNSPVRPTLLRCSHFSVGMSGHTTRTGSRPAGPEGASESQLAGWQQRDVPALSGRVDGGALDLGPLRAVVALPDVVDGRGAWPGELVVQADGGVPVYGDLPGGALEVLEGCLVGQESQARVDLVGERGGDAPPAGQLLEGGQHVAVGRHAAG